ncbi:MAG TPA: hypothetical protein G4O10_00590 [Dehalococcoidia bacterium]|nr:hypothetical protein [Dehalococcoidia bacterium]
MKRCIPISVMTILIISLIIPIGCKTAEFELSSLEITPSCIAIGDKAIVSVDVTNIGSAEGTCTVTLSLDGVVVDTKDVNIPAMSTREVTFDVIKETIGEYTVEIGNLNATLSVVEPVILEFRELKEVSIDSAENGELETIFMWVPATGIIDGEEKVLNSSYFKRNTYVTTSSQMGGVVLHFEWNEEGTILSEQITSRLIGQPLGIFVGSGADAQPLLGEDGQPIAPIIRDVITDAGIIMGLSLKDAVTLSEQLNAAR